MSAAVYSAEVVETGGAKVRLRLYIVHADEHSFCVKKNCALQILWDQVNAAEIKCALGDEMTLANRLDAKWVISNEDRFIKSVKLIETKNHPAPPGFSFKKHLKKRVGLPQALIEIVATDKKWIEHLKKGQTWDTAPYDMEFYV